MSLFEKLKNAIFGNIITTVIGLVGSLAVVASDYGIVFSPERKTAIVAAILALLGLTASDGGGGGNGEPE
jgi:hypothetical protein